jgi:hypothetical protein
MHSDTTEYKGSWEPIQYRFKHLPVHMALLHTGKVLAFGGSGNDQYNLGNPLPGEIFDPGRGRSDRGEVFEIPNTGIQGDIFCAGHAFLSDGRLLIAGGTYRYDFSLFGIPFPPFSGLEHTYIFDPVKLNWNRMHNMRFGRWYPTCIMVTDGRILCVGGLTKYFPWAFLNKLEVFSNTDNSWKILGGANRWLPLYPRLHLLPSGEIFFAGSYNTHYTFPFSRVAFPSAKLNVQTKEWTSIGNPNNINREEGTTVLLPLIPPDYSARVLLIGGGTPTGTEAINDVEMIDFSEKHPRYKPIAPLIHPRYYAYAVILPDKQVLVLGGRVGKKGHAKPDEPHHTGHHDVLAVEDHEVPQDPMSVREPELFNPEKGEWAPVAKMQVDRLYHSNALLLPDGRVMTAGSNPQRGINELRIELFCPSYLFRGNRPMIKKCPDTVRYGTNFEIEIFEAADIKSVALIRPSATTHCVNPEQRYVGLEFIQKNSNTILARMPLNRNVLPTGYYMLFILNYEDVPSVAYFILVN